MTLHYLDPSAWIKRHFHEPGSEAIGDLFRTINTAACCRLGLVEMLATIIRKSRAVSLESSVTQQLIRNVKADFAVFDVAAVDEAMIEQATDLALKHGLRTMDAIHLAAALSHARSVDTIILVSSDLELLTAAEREGLATINPVS